MDEYLIQGSTLTAIADAIRSMDGTSDAIPASQFASRVLNIPVANIDTLTIKKSSNALSIDFSGLKGMPKSFSVVADGQLSLGTTRYVGAVHSHGTTTYGIYLHRSSSSGTMYYSDTYFTWTYSGGTLTILSSSSTNGGYFASSVNYRLIYTY